jgi:hypothetical protein
MQRGRAFCGFGGVFVSLLSLVGCGGDGMSEVSGSVKVDGKSLEKGAITFFPVDGKASTTGGTISGGQYSVRVPAGTMKVTISAPKFNRKKKLYPDDPKSPEMDLYDELLPIKYSDHERTELRLEVTGGKVSKDWELSTK